MRFKRLISVFMLIVMMIGNLTGFAAETEVVVDKEKSTRDVYVRANDTQDGNVTTAYYGDPVNVYLAVDDPNKGYYNENATLAEDENIDIEIKKHEEPQYDLNGYIVKFYYDSEFFNLKSPDKNKPIDCSVPIKKAVNEPDRPDSDDEIDDFKVPAGFYIDSHGAGEEIINGKKYSTAYITVLFNGIWLPQKTDPDKWYDLCSLPLEAKKTGLTEVFIETNDIQENYSLELLAKNVSDFPVNFKFSVKNGGYHQINIKNKLRPDPPVPDPKPGTYDSGQKVTLTAEKDCTIYYTFKENPTEADWERFNEKYPIDIPTTSTIKCKAVRSDGQESDIVDFKYVIVPSAPKLFRGENKEILIEEVYNAENPFRTYISVNNPYAPIPGDCEVYYTYSLNASADDMVIGENPEREWVKVDKQLNYLDIDRTRTVRLITIKGEEHSYVSVYYLGIRPAPALASPEPVEDQKKTDVTLKSETVNADIYYTVDGSDPRINGILYTGPITISQTTTLRTVAKYQGIYSELRQYDYILDPLPPDAVVAFPLPGAYEEVDVELSTPGERDIYYTTDNSDPTDKDNPNRHKYEEGNPIHIEEDTVIKAITEDENGKPGEVYEFEYRIKPQPPIFSPESTQFIGGGNVAIYNAAPDKNHILYYTTDGSDPITSPTRNQATGDHAVVNITTFTEIKAVTQGENGTYSEVVSHVYDVIYSRPSKPMVTLEEGVYELKNGVDMSYSTRFVPVPDGVTTYYTVAYESEGDYPQPDPNKGYEQTKEYKPGDEIPIKGNTIIKAVAENAMGVRSDIAVFHYTIVPQAPEAPPSTTLSGGAAPLLITAVPGSAVTYTLNEVTNTLVAPDNGIFYIDPETGNAYEDKEMKKPLGKDSGIEIHAPLNLSIYCEKDGIQSSTNKYRYAIASDEMLAVPYADKDSGDYVEIAIDKDNNLLEVKLASINKDADIEYRVAGEDNWTTYTSPLKFKEDTVLYIRARKGDRVSTIATYVYRFVPPMPVITPEEGKYSNTLTVKLSVPENAPKDRSYTIYYKRSGESTDIRYVGQEIEINSSMSIKAYIVEDDQTRNAKYSETETAYYIIDGSDMTGKVSVAAPYDERNRFAVTEIVKAPYSEGIKLVSSNPNADIMYTYEYTLSNGTVVKSAPELLYSTPIIVSPSMKDIKITAWLIDDNGSEISGSRDTFEYTFIALKVPVPSLENSTSDTFASGTQYTIINNYPNDKNIRIYYTLDGSDPSLTTNPNRKLYSGETLKTTTTTTNIKTVYVSYCGECEACHAGKFTECSGAVYGEVGTYTYPVKTTGGSGGGGGGGGGGIRTTPKPSPSPAPTEKPSDNDRYTTDWFGRVYPEHVSYISGYPDGSVRPENNITREEISQIVFRIMDKEDNPPSPATGEMYPDISADRWSAQQIEYLSVNDIAEGYPDELFRPADNMTRAEFCTMIARFLGLEIPDEASMPFEDIPKDHWGILYIQAMYNAGFINGYEDGTFRADRQLSRAEAIIIFNKILGRKPLAEYLVTTEYIDIFNDLETNKWYFADVLESAVTHEYDLNIDRYEEFWYVDKEKNELLYK